MALDLPVTANGNVTFFVGVPVGTAVGGHVARFRLRTATGLGVGGAAPDGEVEDHVVTVSPAPAPVFVDDNWVGVAPAADPDGAGPATAFGFYAFATGQQGLTVVANAGSVVVLPGMYPGSPAVANKSVTLIGAVPAAATRRRFAHAGQHGARGRHLHRQRNRVRPRRRSANTLAQCASSAPRVRGIVPAIRFDSGWSCMSHNRGRSAESIGQSRTPTSRVTAAPLDRVTGPRRAATAAGNSAALTSR